MSEKERAVRAEEFLERGREGEGGRERVVVERKEGTVCLSLF